MPRAGWSRQPTNTAQTYPQAMFQMAVYGKGGIGKSTLSANISLALAESGLRVMQVGCDPKHDSTRLLLGGRAQRTVLDYVRDVPVGRRRLEDVIEEGSGGVLCAEAGGPEPGIGCAGRGILTTFETLKRLGADSLETDVRVYDVLGDVVCGGFAVPLRGDYADAVILVTSGEFMAMYAANNIMRGLLNFDTGGPRLLGIVLNSRGVEGESEAVRRLADAAGTRVLAEIPRDGLFAEAEAAGRTVMEMFPDSEAASALREVAEAVRGAMDGTVPLTSPTPLDDLQLSDLAAGRPIRPASGGGIPRTGCPGCGLTHQRVMMSCAAYGAANAFARVGGTAVLVHGPMSCAYLMDVSRAKAVADAFAGRVSDRSLRSGIRSTFMDDEASIFGGNAYLKAALDRAYADGYRRIAVVTTCMPGIIGDDCLAVTDAFSREHPGVRLSLVRADGDVAGDYTDGFMLAAESVAESMDTSLEPDPGLVNLVGVTFFDLQSRDGLRTLEGMLSVFGLRVNCMFLDERSPAPPEEFCCGSADIPVSDTAPVRDVMSIISRRTGRAPFPAPLPLGIRAYREWIRAMGRLTGKESEAEAEVARAEADYAGLVEAHRPRMEGRSALVVWKMGGNPDWLLDTLEDLGVDIVRVGFNTISRKAGGIPDTSHEAVADYTDAQLMEDLDRFRPDFLIGDVVRPVPDGTTFVKLVRMGVGYRTVFDFVRTIGNTPLIPATEGWRMIG